MEVVIGCIIYAVIGYVVSALMERFFEFEDGGFNFMCFIIWPVALLVLGVVLACIGLYGLWQLIAGKQE